jgi:hypothetical protein
LGKKGLRRCPGKRKFWLRYRVSQFRAEKLGSITIPPREAFQHGLPENLLINIYSGVDESH